MLVFLKISMMIVFPKLEPLCLLRWFVVPLPSYRQNPSHPESQMETSHFHSPPHISTVPFQHFLRRNWSSHVRYAFSPPPSLPANTPTISCRKSVVRKTLPAAPVDTFYRILIISFSTVLHLSLYANLSLTPQYAPRRVAQRLGLFCSCLFCFSIPRKELGSTTTQSSRSKIKTKQYALQIVKK